MMFAMVDSKETVLNQLMHDWNSALAWEIQFDHRETLKLARAAPGQQPEMTRAGPPILYRGLPGDDREHSRRWLGDRFFCYLNGPPQKRIIAPVSSRLKQRLDLERWWFDLLRTLILRCDAAAEMIAVVESTAPFLAASRAALLFGRTLIRFELPSIPTCRCDDDLRCWFSCCLDRIQQAAEQPSDETVEHILVSPELHADLTGVDECESEFSGLPLGDRLLFAAADRIQILSCRAKGTVSELMRLHLLDPDRSSTSLLMACDEKGLFSESAKDLPDGWVPWILQPTMLPEESTPVFAEAPARISNSPVLDRQDPEASGNRPLSNNPLQKPDDWLLHWTRAAAGPWPGESSEDFLDALILRTETADHSAVTTLLRILSEGFLRASADGIRGSFPVVAFTGVPLHEFRQRRVFRKHRHRFDFEPWGVAIRKSRLMDLGVRPVFYGDDEIWNSLNSEERRFFQKATAGGATNNSDEFEWRVADDVDLSQLSQADVCVFVDSIEAAQLVSFHCPWNVIVVPEKTRSDTPARG
jgi:hypothetical protein